MAKIQKNSILQGLSGSVGEMVFRQMPDGSTRVSAKPNNKRKFNQEQKGHQDRLCLLYYPSIGHIIFSKLRIDRSNDFSRFSTS